MKLLLLSALCIQQCFCYLVFDIEGYVTNYSYPFEQYRVETDDGYRLALHRIPYGRNMNSSYESKGVVFLMHGLLAASNHWVILGSPKALAFYLADRGYDVWMGNARGNTYSRQHRTLSPDDGKFWQFGWHEIGIYDLPAMIDFVLNKTDNKKLSYIGHSQGSTCLFVLGSEKPEYLKKIKLFTALAPVVYLTRMKQPLAQISANFAKPLHRLGSFIGLHEIVPGTDLLNKVDRTVCEATAIFTKLCANVLFLLAGFDSVQMEKETVPLIMETTPAGSSLRQAVHFAQLLKTSLVNFLGRLCPERIGKFTKFDFGRRTNMKMYGSAEPPRYKLQNMLVPTLLVYGANDWLVSTQDVRHLADKLPWVVDSYLVPFEKFNHLDFTFAKDADYLVYDEVLKFIEIYN